MEQVTQPRIEALFDSHPQLVVQGFRRAHFLLEAKRCIEFLGAHSPSETRDVLAVLQNAEQPLLADFARARLAAAGHGE